MNEPVRIGGATLFCGDCYEIMAREGFPEADALVADPPYGIKYEVNARSWQNEGLTALKPWEMEKRPAIHGDDKPFDCAPFVTSFGKVALFGANYMQGLPRGKWLVWDKRRESNPDDHSDCEFIWLSKVGADRIHRQKWRGIVREGEENCSRSRKLHPNQKPVALIGRIFDELGVEPDDVVLDPFMGSGSTGVVALRRGHRFIGIEKDTGHFETACRRLLAEVDE